MSLLGKISNFLKGFLGWQVYSNLVTWLFYIFLTNTNNIKHNLYLIEILWILLTWALPIIFALHLFSKKKNWHGAGIITIEIINLAIGLYLVDQNFGIEGFLENGQIGELIFAVLLPLPTSFLLFFGHNSPAMP